VSDSKTSDWLYAHATYPYKDWCLIWPFAREPRVGRGMMGFNGKRGWTHRFMCELANGPEPEGKPQVAHSCGNGHLGCVNPNHLSWCDNSENQHQRYAHGCPPSNTQGNRSRFTPEQIETIRSQWGEFTQVKLAEMYGVSLGTIQYYLKYREQRGHTGGLVRHWHPDEDEMLKQIIASGAAFKDSEKNFDNRTAKAMRQRARRLGYNV
jgi:HNH endonuclease